MTPVVVRSSTVPTGIGYSIGQVASTPIKAFPAANDVSSRGEEPHAFRTKRSFHQSKCTVVLFGDGLEGRCRVFIFKGNRMNDDV